MPTLESLSKHLMPEALATGILENRGPASKRTRALHLGFARMIDHAVAEYEHARLGFAQWNEERDFLGIEAGITHLESTLVSLHRAVEFLHRLRLRGMQNLDGSPVIRRPRDFPILEDKTRNRIRDARDEVQHLDERIFAAVDDPDSPISIVAEDLGVHAGPVYISYAELSAWLTTLHGEARRLSYLERHDSQQS